MIKAGIIGGAGYTAGELLRILLRHPEVEIAFVNSQSNFGKYVYEVHEDLIGETTLKFGEPNFSAADVIFLCQGHGHSKTFLQGNNISRKTKIIDLSQDFRLKEEGNDFVYGLPEINRDKITQATHIANPGCFATAIQLAILPLFSSKFQFADIHINGITGSTGAGQAPSATTHFSWRNDNVSVYKPFVHQHLKEINESVHQLQEGYQGQLNFIPMRGNFSRGILVTAYTQCDSSLEELKAIYKDFYRGHPFVSLSDKSPNLKMVVNTNKCVLSLEKVDSNLLITSVIDNLVKGASGQAVQNMNLLFGLDETTGLKLKPIGY
ncbi:MAG: N-acetyl-gamma-glutamyl-phosphate reductase [Bacteroidota bacterium]|nr:N-acetyl-gamma-glutamyl-phosphate reductase [Bacteroidota bacterium]